MNLSDDEKKILLSAARFSINAVYDNSTPPQIDYTNYPNLKINTGAFVTLTKGKRLRGCIGNIIGEQPLFQTVCEMAVHAAIHDPRFPPLRKSELDEIEIEISVLSIPHSINSYNDIEIGRDGLILDEINSAVLLPQVPIEHNMNREEFLSALCEKAGLHQNTWRERQLKLKTFTALVFSENKNP
ncbi:MAG: AmmeMemoRadiSam system protein A [Ignavibacteriales bacterium]|nr:AmmeMemoRadiSam system protein A [Ignavibacteriales bacterium]